MSLPTKSRFQEQGTFPSGQLGWLTCVALVAWFTPVARAQDTSSDAKAQCATAFDQVQTLREKGALTQAREQAIECARATCGPAIAKECGGWLDEISRALPSVVLAATGPDSGDLTDVKVTMDGAVLADKLGPRSLSVDPGEHTFVFESSTLGKAEVRVVVREGEKDRLVKVALGKPAGAQAIEMERPIPVGFWVFGSAGLAGLVVGSVFEGLALAKHGELEPECVTSQTCSETEVDEMVRNFLIGDVAIGVGAAGLAGALIVFLTRPEVPVSAEVSVSASASGQGAWFGVGTTW